jgi:integrase/recombinase XerD
MEEQQYHINKRLKYRTPVNRSVSLRLFYRGILALHLLESGTDLRYIQLLLGHNSTRTNEVYKQIAINNIKAIKSPFDNLHLK